MPQKKHGNVKNPKQYEGLRKKGMSKERAARIANSPGASERGGKTLGLAEPVVLTARSVHTGFAR